MRVEEVASPCHRPPRGTGSGNILMPDSIIFTTLFGGTESLAKLLEERGQHVAVIALRQWRLNGTAGQGRTGGPEAGLVPTGGSALM